MARNTRKRTDEGFPAIDGESLNAFAVLYVCFSVFGVCFLWFFAGICACVFLNGLLGGLQGRFGQRDLQNLGRLLSKARHSEDPVGTVTGLDRHRFSLRGNAGIVFLLLILALAYSVIPISWNLAMVAAATVIFFNLKVTNRLFVLQFLHSALSRRCGREVSVDSRLSAYLLGLGIPLMFLPLFVASRLNGLIFEGMSSLSRSDNWTFGSGSMLTVPLFATAVVSCWLRVSPPAKLDDSVLRVLIREAAGSPRPDLTS